MPSANISSVDGNDDPFFARPKIGKLAAAFRERPAEERLHRAEQSDRGEKQAQDRDRGEPGGERERAFEDQEFADEAVQSGQA